MTEATLNDAEPQSPPARSRPRGPGRAIRRALVILAVSCTALGVVVAAINGFVWARSKSFVYEDPKSAPPRSFAIVPGAGVGPDGRLSTVLFDRLKTARDLYARGVVRAILVSGDNEKPSYDEVTPMRAYLEKNGVAKHDIVIDPAGLRTLDTMRRAATVFGVRDAIVCTQQFHLARSVFLARSAGIDAVGAVADRHVYEQHYLNQTRELVARAWSVIDTYVLHTQPKFRGEVTTR